MELIISEVCKSGKNLKFSNKNRSVASDILEQIIHGNPFKSSLYHTSNKHRKLNLFLNAHLAILHIIHCLYIAYIK